MLYHNLHDQAGNSILTDHEIAIQICMRIASLWMNFIEFMVVQAEFNDLMFALKADLHCRNNISLLMIQYKYDLISTIYSIAHDKAALCIDF